MASKLILEKKAEELLNKEVYPMLKLFPKAEKFALCHEIKSAFYQFLKCIMLANNVKAKRRMFIEEAEGYHKLLLVGDYKWLLGSMVTMSKAKNPCFWIS